MNSFATENMAGDTEGGGSTVWFITTTPLLPTGPGGDDDPLIGTTFNDTSASSLWTNATDEIYSDAYDDNVTTSSSSVYSMAWPMRSAWIAIFAFMLVVAFVGNTLVAWVVLAHRRMKTVTNYFLVNLSLADLTMSLFNCVFNFTFMLNNHWPFGSVYCAVNNFIANVTVAASVFTLVAISFDRYIAIVHPLRPRMSKFVARVAISLIWVASGALAIPCLLYSHTLSHSYDGQTAVACLMLWPDGLPNVSESDFIYNIFFTVLTYLVPTLIMACCYTRMSFTLWRSRSIGELNQRQLDSIQTKRKVVRMFIVIVMLFILCWLPYHGYFVYQYIDSSVVSYKYAQQVFLAFYWLAMSNAMINPLVYYYMNPRFRRYFRTVICQCLCCAFCCGRLSSNGNAVGLTTEFGAPTTQNQYLNGVGIGVGGGGGGGHSTVSQDARSDHAGRSAAGATRTTGIGPVGRRRPNNIGPSSSSSRFDAMDRRPINGRQRIIRFTTRRMVIFQRITSGNVNPGVEIPLVHSTLLANHYQRHHPTSWPPHSAASGAVNGDTKSDNIGVPRDASPSPPSNNTSVAYSYL